MKLVSLEQCDQLSALLGQALNEKSPPVAFDPDRLREFTITLYNRPPGTLCELEVIDGEIAGFVIAQMEESLLTGKRFAKELSIYVSPNHRGGNLWQRLFRKLEQWAIEGGAFSIHGSVEDQHLKFSEHCGFVKIDNNVIKPLEEH